MYKEIRNARSSNYLVEIFGTQEERLGMSEEEKSELKTGSVFVEVDTGGTVYGFVEDTQEWHEYKNTSGGGGIYSNMGLKIVP